MRTVSPTIFDNKEITCRYNGKDRSGVVETVRHCVEKGYLLTVNTSEGYRSFWLNKTSNIAIVKQSHPNQTHTLPLGDQRDEHLSTTWIF